MKVDIECFPCFLRQSVSTLEYVDIPENEKIEIVKSVLTEIEETDIDRSPAFATTFIYRKIKNLTGVDPYKEIKERYNDLALGLSSDLRERIKNTPDPLLTASRLAIAGNIIDFGLFKSIDMEATIERALSGNIEVDDFDLFRHETEARDTLLYLLDNAGEIVFDLLLIEQLKSMGKRVIAVVKGGPVINDATIDDAERIGLTKICQVIDNGSDAVGTFTEFCSDEFNEIYNNAALIISKGQGNFETLTGNGKNIFFLFQAKCDVVARYLGIEKGSMLLKRNL